MPENNTLGKGRLEAFSDGVIAIIITIMVLELDIMARGSALRSRPACSSCPISN
jgi:uncharacterized membrane protein